MTYFQNFPNIQYDYSIKSDPSPIIETVPDLLQRVTLKISDSDKQLLCQDYVIADGETPEKIAFKFYNDPLLHWTVMYINSICDFHAEWPLQDQALLAYCQRKYGVDNVYSIHHYEKMPEMLVMDLQFMQDQINAGNFDQGCSVAVTNFDYEERLNTLKRFIKIIKPSSISGFVKLFTSAQII